MKKIQLTLMAGAVCAASQLFSAADVQAGARVDLSALIVNPGKNIERLLDSKRLETFRNDVQDSDNPVMERIKNRCNSLKKELNLTVNCDRKY